MLVGLLELGVMTMNNFDIWFDENGRQRCFYDGESKEEMEIIHQEFVLNVKAQFGQKWYEGLFTKNFKAGMVMVLGTIFMMSTDFNNKILEIILDISVAMVAWYFFEKLLEGKK